MNHRSAAAVCALSLLACGPDLELGRRQPSPNAAARPDGGSFGSSGLPPEVGVDDAVRGELRRPESGKLEGHEDLATDRFPLLYEGAPEPELRPPGSIAVAARQAGGSSPASPPAVATWSGGTVSREQLESWLLFQRLEEDPERRREAIEEMLLVETLAAAAERRGADREPRLRSALRRAEEQLLAAALERYRRSRIAVSDPEVAAYRREHPDLLRRPRKLRLRNLFLRFPPAAGVEERGAVRRRMQTLAARLEAGADFAELARLESDSQTRFRGGLLGNVAASELRGEIAAAASRLEPGEVSQILETPDGLTLLLCEQVFEAYEPTEEEVEGAAAAHLRRLRLRSEQEALAAELERAARPRLDLEAARTSGAQPGQVVARFEGGRLTLEDLRTELDARPARRELAELDDQQLRELLEQRVRRALEAAEAHRLGLGEDPLLRRRLHWEARRLLAAGELARRVQAELRPLAEEEVRAFFEAHREDYERPPHYELALIRIDLEPGRELQIYRQAEELRTRLMAGEVDFPAAARRYSDHPSSERGGDLGRLSRRQLAGFGPLLLRTVDSLAAGEIGPLVQQERSLYLLELRGRQPARPLSWEEAARPAGQRLGVERAAAARRRIEAHLVETLDVELLGEPGAAE